MVSKGILYLTDPLNTDSENSTFASRKLSEDSLVRYVHGVHGKVVVVVVCNVLQNEQIDWVRERVPTDDLHVDQKGVLYSTHCSNNLVKLIENLIADCVLVLLVNVAKPSENVTKDH